jgi:hypothetical protein
MIADSGSLAAALRNFIDAYMRTDFEKVLPCRVESHDRDANRVEVQPLVMIGTETSEKVRRAKRVNLPVLRLGGGGYFISVPIKKGDLGWIVAADRDISLVLKSLDEDWPDTLRMHNFADAFFIPDTFKEWAIDGKNADALVIQSMDGDTCIALEDGRVEIDAAAVKINGDLEIAGSVKADGDIEAAGAVKADGEVTAMLGLPVPAPVKLSTHSHPTAAPGTPSPPTPFT